jgi:hypothetical protein
MMGGVRGVGVLMLVVFFILMAAKGMLRMCIERWCMP